MTYKHQDFPSWRYGPNGQSVVVNSEDETPPGFSATRRKDGTGGTQTAVAPSNATVSAEEAAKTTDAVSRASTDIDKAANAGVGGTGTTATAQTVTGTTTSDESKGADPSTITLDADGHAYDPNLHAATKSKTKAGLWRMKVGVSRPAPKPGFPKQPLDL